VQLDRGDERLAFVLDQKLQEGYHYRYSRKLNELKPVQVAYLNQDAVSFYLEKKGRMQRLGVVKKMVLEKNNFWEDRDEEA